MSVSLLLSLKQGGQLISFVQLVSLLYLEFSLQTPWGDRIWNETFPAWTLWNACPMYRAGDVHLQYLKSELPLFFVARNLPYLIYLFLTKFIWFPWTFLSKMSWSYMLTLLDYLSRLYLAKAIKVNSFETWCLFVPPMGALRGAHHHSVGELRTIWITQMWSRESQECCFSVPLSWHIQKC